MQVRTVIGLDIRKALIPTALAPGESGGEPWTCLRLGARPDR